ncbi:MAG TPA: AraC family transcriptional regulator [Alphaproteobacteria bacterium]|jgi:AraC-like DNA-binding protein
MIAILDLLLRGAGLGALAVTVALMARQYGSTVAGRLGIVFAAAIMAALFCPLVAHRWNAGPWGLPVYAACSSVAGLFWLFVRAWFDDAFRPRPLHWLAIGALTALHLWRGAGMHEHAGQVPDDDLAGALNALPFLLDLAFIVAALLRAGAGKADDLDEARRRFRDVMVRAIGGYMVLVTGLSIYLFYRQPAPLVDFLILVGTVFLIFGFLLMTARLQNRLFGDRLLGGPVRAESPPAPDAADEQLHAALLRCMNHDKGYRAPGLTITALAEKLGTPEYRLRRLINGRLGHRNFNDFVNGYRLAEARLRLADPEAARLPVLTIALDAGFQSIGPFNRAFKDDTGMTPVEYRRSKLGQSGAESEKT